MILAANQINAKRSISFATGSIWKYRYDNNKRMKLLRSLDLGLGGVEITLSTSDQVFYFKLSWMNRRWLGTLPRISIHAPFDLVSAGRVNEQMDRMCRLYRGLKAENVVIHPNTLPPPEMLDKYPDMKFSTENLPPREGGFKEDLRAIFERYPRLGLCLDTTHAFSWSQDETAALADRFYDRLTQIHLSGNENGKQHTSMRTAPQKYLDSIGCIFHLPAPVVIELDYGEMAKNALKNELVEEISYIRNMFAATGRA